MADPHPPLLPDRVQYVIEVPRGSRIKRGPDGGMEYVSPWPCPFNYGSVPSRLAADGDPADVVVLGPRLSRGSSGEALVVAVARFEDAGLTDDKWIAVHGQRTLTLREQDQVVRFFTRYARIKHALGRLRGHSGATRFLGLEPR